MLRRWILAMSMALLAVGSALAQSGSRAPVVSAEQTIGRAIYTAGGERVGEIEAVILGPSGEARAAVVGVGGFLGIGQRQVAIDWTRLDLPRGDGDIIVSITEAQLRALPEYQYPAQAERGGAFRDQRWAVSPEGDSRATRAANERIATPPQDAGTGSSPGGNLLGADVLNQQDRVIGNVEDVIVDGDGEIVSVVVSVGGFLGLGDRDVAIAWDAVDVDARRDSLKLVVELSEQELRSLPAYQPPVADRSRR